MSRKPILHPVYNMQCSEEIVPDKSTSTTLRNPSLAHKYDSAGSLLFKANQLNRIYTYVSGVLRKVVLVDLSGTISSEH
jgi:hypothetical protein